MWPLKDFNPTLVKMVPQSGNLDMQALKDLRLEYAPYWPTLHNAQFSDILLLTGPLHQSVYITFSALVTKIKKKLIENFSNLITPTAFIARQYRNRFIYSVCAIITFRWQREPNRVLLSFFLTVDQAMVPLKLVL